MKTNALSADAITEICGELTMPTEAAVTMEAEAALQSSRCPRRLAALSLSLSLVLAPFANATGTWARRGARSSARFVPRVAHGPATPTETFLRPAATRTARRHRLHMRGCAVAHRRAGSASLCAKCFQGAAALSQDASWAKLAPNTAPSEPQPGHDRVEDDGAPGGPPVPPFGRWLPSVPAYAPLPTLVLESSLEANAPGGRNSVCAGRG